MNVKEEHLKILVHCGLHGRVAVNLAEIALEKQVDLLISAGGRQVNCNSILELLSLGLAQGSQIKVRVEGEQASAAMQAVQDLLVNE
jgi:phosphotransferase system HPr (HPr) family protein